MSSNPSGSFAGTRPILEDELDRTIGRLNSNFALQLRKPDQTLSPSQRRLQPRSEYEARNDVIYAKLRALCYRRGRALSYCLGKFETEARKILPNASGENAATFAEEHPAALQQCLLDVLNNRENVDLASPVSKRIGEDASQSPPKRARNRQVGNREHLSGVDGIPVCSRLVDGRTISLGRSIDDEQSSNIFLSTVWNTSRSNFSMTSSRQSLPSDVFSSNPTENVSFITYTTVDSDYQDKVSDKAHLIPEGHSQRPFEALSASNKLSSMQITSHLPVRDRGLMVSQGAHSFQTTRSENNKLDNIASLNLASVDGRSSKTQDATSQTFEDRLKNIWPRFPYPALTEAPLAVIWELTRAAIHCNVNLEEFDLPYETNNGWEDQKKLRSKMSEHPLFHGKDLPSPCDSMLWKAALADFTCNAKTVTLSAELTYNDTEPMYRFHLNPLKLELGHRLDRRFGADRFLEVVIPSPSTSKHQPDTLKNDGLERIIQWLIEERHYFLGRTWVPFFVRSVKGKKDINLTRNANSFPERIYFFACDGNKFRPALYPLSIPPQEEAFTPNIRTKLKLSGLLNWAVEIGDSKNSKQPVTKLFSRLALSLSRTWPTVRLERSQIRFPSRDLGIHKVMNDGIGRISRSLAEDVSKVLGLSDCPSCFQGRIGSAKGIWLIETPINGDDKWIELYPSQIKWDCSFTDPHHRTLEVRGWPSELKSAALNQQFIPVLESQALNPMAMRHVIAEHLRNALMADLDEQTAAMKEPMDLRLWITKSGSFDNDRSSNGCAQFLAGLPDSNVDKVGFLLDSGFHQTKSKYLNELIWKICSKKAETLKSKMNITVPCSAYVYMAADFSSTLEEDEVHLSFSTKFQVEGFSDTLLENMDVLVARAPAHFPSDIQRVRIVSRPELRKLKDVIVFSTKGTTPLADKLSGGDYDGDIAWVCWDNKIVENFRNARVPKGPDLVKLGYLRERHKTFDDILADCRGKSLQNDPYENELEIACSEFIRDALLFNLQPSYLGKCTKYKERLCYYENCVTTDAAIALSTLLSKLVDQAKQGLEFTEQDWHRLLTVYLHKSIFLDDPEYMKDRASSNLGRKRELHILDFLKFEVADTLINESLTKFSNATKNEELQEFDADLTKFYNAYDEYGNDSNEPAKKNNRRHLLSYLKDEIQKLADLWKKKIYFDDGNSGFKALVQEMYQIWLDIQPPVELQSSEIVLELFRNRDQDPTFNGWNLLKASATFKHQHNSSSKFVWHMAGKQLAFLKARANRMSMESTAPPVLVIPQMWGILRPDKKLITRLAVQREIARDSESVAALEEVWELDDDTGTVIDDA